MGWSELILVGVVALIVVGPKDLPVMFQALGKMTAKIKRMAREFSSAMSDAARESGANDIMGDLNNINSPKNFGINALKDAADSFDKWEPSQPRVMGSETAKLAQERAEKARKIHQRTAEVAQARLDKEAAAALKAAKMEGVPDKKTTPKKPAAKKLRPKKQQQSQPQKKLRLENLRRKKP